MTSKKVVYSPSPSYATLELREFELREFELREFLLLTVQMSNQYNFLHQLSNKK